MNWESIKFDWNKARAFLATAETGSFSSAARALGMSQPTLGRQVSSLEEELGVILIERVAHGIELTPTGLQLLSHIKDMGEAASRFSLSAAGRKNTIEGKVRISCTDTLAVYVLPQLLQQLHKAEPRIIVEVISSYEISDLLRRESDIAIRHSQPAGNELIARKLPDQLVRLYYANRLSAEINNLPVENHPFVGFLSQHQEYIEELRNRGVNISELNFRSFASNHVEHWSLVRAGMGVGMMAESIAKQCDDVTPYSAMKEPMAIPTWLVTHRELRNNLRIRRVYDYLAESLSSLLES